MQVMEIYAGGDLRVGIVARPEIPGAIGLSRKVLKLLSKEEVLLEEGLAKKLGERGVDWRALREADAIITIGGDGTVLLAQKQIPGVPILGINLGGRGFLADVEPIETERALRMLTRGELPIIERMRLAVETSERLPDALNDAVMYSARLGKTLTLRVMVDGKVAMDFQGDGIIITTPTGSTAYAFTAGGPIIDPSLEAFGVVPVCPFPLARPLMVSASRRIEVKPTRPELGASIIIDGQPAEEIEPGDKAIFYKSDKPARFFGVGDFYRKLRERLQWREGS